MAAKASYRTITLTYASLSTLANNTTQASSTVDNSTNADLELMVQVSVSSTATTGSAAGYVNVYLVRSFDNSAFDDSGVTQLSHMTRIGTFAHSGAAATSSVASFSTAPYGILPPYFKIAIENQTGVAFTAGTVTARAVQIA